MEISDFNCMPSFCFLQHTSQSPDGKLLIIVGDNPEGLLVDSVTGKVCSFVNMTFFFFKSFSVGSKWKQSMTWCSTDACVSGA